MRFLCLVLIASLLGACGKNDDDNSANAGTNNGMSNTPDGECATDEDCPAASDATFANPANARCTMSAVRGNYCSECINDNQCGAGYACREATYCEELPPCDRGAECADQAGEVHQACIAGFCNFCLDDADCEADEVCYSRLCATRTTVDPTCIDVSCEGTCEIEYDGDGAATGIACTQ